VVSGQAPPRIVLRVDQTGANKVSARLVFWPLAGNGQILRVDLGRVRTGREITATWPAGAVIAPGEYTVRLHVKGRGGKTLLRRARASGKATLKVTAPPPPAITPGGNFPVAGPHNFGGEDARFGAQRDGHTHQGQDVLAAEGTPVVAPLSGTIIARDNQPGGAGFYLTEHASDGRDFFFAHCQEGSFAVDKGSAVTQGQQLCRVGHTGDATGSHLHFEIWVGGWRVDANSHPIDPLPDLQAWDQGAAPA
jgi:murein DD-endopeptidase MepM/ murein hydrolase activator NlpD